MEIAAQNHETTTRRHQRAESEFLNPKSMLTPGAAGAVIMLISNALWVTFGFPSNWSALLFSFLFALMVVGHYVAPFWHKALLMVFNSLIVFSLGVGTMSMGSAAFGQRGSPGTASSSMHQPAAATHSSFILNLIPAAAADDGRPVLAQKKRGFWDPWFDPKKDKP
jgi:hypothetical protein